MSKEAFEAVIGKVLLDAEFCSTLLADPDRALAGFELTEEEKSVLKSIDYESIDAMSHILRPRIRKISSVKEE